MKTLILTFRRGGAAHVRTGIAAYLPGLDVCLTSLDTTTALLPAPTWNALRLEYGEAGARAIVGQAGAMPVDELDDQAALTRLRARDRRLLSSRASLLAPAVAAAAPDWPLEMLKLRAAWALVGGPDAIDWRDVRVGHIDTGLTPHPVFGPANASWVDFANGATFFKESIPGDPDGPGSGIDPVATQMDGHGTRTASVLCGHAPAAPGGPFYGVAPKVPLVPVRIANHVLINHAQRQFGLAVNHLVTTADVDVISLSMGIFPPLVMKVMRTALNQAYEAGVIVVCAAGNHVSKVVPPARLSRSLAIAGVTPSAQPWHDSSYGVEVDVSGPAAGVWRASTPRAGKFVYGGGGDGTSYATAMTAGAAALWLRWRRDALAVAYPQPWQRVEAFAQLLRESAWAPPGWGTGFGAGIVNVEKLLHSPLPPASSLVQAPKA